jgi:hypothetical protein
MEIEKIRETSWKIQLKRKNESIELTSVEISGEVRAIKLTLFKDDNSLMSEMNKEEFFNFLSLISAFKDVVIGEDSFLTEQTLIDTNMQENTKDQEDFKEDLYSTESESSNMLEKKISDEKLNPEEWDPW